jgi:high-affinity nickel-transport protein
MTSALVILSLGFLLGIRHATDPDHVIAVSTIVSRERNLTRASRIGALWGLGHTATIVAVGAPLILFRWTVSPKLGAAMELGVAMMLIVLGVASLIDIRRGGSAGKSHSHLHRHGDRIHRHRHGHVSTTSLSESGQEHRATSPHDDSAHGHAEQDTAVAAVDRLAGGLRAYGAIRPVVVGVIHGLAGSAAIALMILATIRTPLLAVAYLLIFGLGTILGMVLLTTAIAVPVVATGRSLGTNRRLRIALALVSVSFGVFLAFRIGIPLARM